VKGRTIGGDIIRLQVTGEGVTSRVVREWGDKIGVRVAPIVARRNA
jgi:hypothetical protein